MKKNLFHIIISNLIYLLLVAGNNFLLPKFTSVETYAAVKEYTLYLTTYGSILTLGYVQGMYVKYGGKKISEISPSEIGINVMSYFGVLLPAAVAVSVYGLIKMNTICTALGAGLISTNLILYYQLFYQATGDFKSYGLALNTSRFAVLAINAFLIFVLRTDKRILYVAVQPLIGVLASIYLTVKLNRKIPFIKRVRFSRLAVRDNVKGGFILMLGEYTTKIFSSIDRWFIKYLMTTFHFAMYSFAVSMDNLINTFMTPVTVSMYNFICRKPAVEEIRKIKDLSLIYSLVIMAGAFPCKWILELFMRDYITSASVMYILFASQGISTIIRGIYVNRYKAEGLHKSYLRQMLTMLALSVALNTVFYFIFRNMIAIAAATLLTNVIWLVICEYQNSDLRFDYNAVFTLAIMLTVYIPAGCKLPSITGCLLYCAVGLFLFMTLMRNRFFYAVDSVLSSFKSKLVRGSY